MPKKDDDDESYNDYFQRVRRAGMMEGIGLVAGLLILIAVLMKIAG
jgi:hypothetical protein